VFAAGLVIIFPVDGKAALKTLQDEKTEKLRQKGEHTGDN